MTPKLFCGQLTATALLFCAAVAGIAQMSGSPLGTSSNRSSAGSAGRGVGLSVVPEDFVKLKLAPGFLVSLNVLEDSDFSGSFRVDDQGDIVVPILGSLHVAGESVSEARVQIRKVLVDNKLLNDPQVDLSVVEYAAPEITVIGEVLSPGKHALLGPQKLIDALAIAGGTTAAAGNEIEIIRGGAQIEPIMVRYSKGSDPNKVKDVIVQPGDTVVVKRAGIVYVLGAVARPGGYVMQEEGTLNVLQAMSMAGGTTQVASIGTVYILRQNADGSKVYFALPYKKIIHGKSGDMQLRATDILYVPASAIKSIYAETQSLVNAAGTTAIYRAMLY